jgi:hypothetical protein
MLVYVIADKLLWGLILVRSCPRGLEARIISFVRCVSTANIMVSLRNVTSCFASSAQSYVLTTYLL